MSLTAKQEKFIQGIVSGLSQREAYKQAYNATRMKDETIDRNACKLMKNNKILTRYKELLDEFKEKSLYTREEAVRDLIWIKEKAKVDINNPKIGLRQGNGTIFVNAIKELAELNEIYPPKRQNVTVDGEMINNPYKDLTKEQLLKLVSEEDG